MDCGYPNTSKTAHPFGLCEKAYVRTTHSNCVRKPIACVSTNRKGSPENKGASNSKTIHAMVATSQRYHFSRLLRRDPPPVPSCLLVHMNPPSQLSSTSTANDRLGHLIDTSGKVKVVLCVHQSGESGGVAITSSAADGTIDSLLSPNHPLNTVSLKHDRDATSGCQTQCITVNSQRNQVTLVDPTPMRRRGGSSLPRTFAFDAIVTESDSKTSLCTVALLDAIRAVLRGQDGCILTIGHKGTGKTLSMLGSDQLSQSAGIVPCAISWLYQSLTHQKQTRGTRYAVRVSAVEICGLNENFRDLLAGVVSTPEDGCSPSHYLQQKGEKDKSKSSSAHVPGSPSNNVDCVAARVAGQLSQQSELRAATMERAAHLLDTALANRSCFGGQKALGLSHMLITFHVYQCHVERNESGTNVHGGRARLHLLDLGCGRYSHQVSCVKESPQCGNGFKSVSKLIHSACPITVENLQNTEEQQITRRLTKDTTKCLSISGMASVLLALLTGQRHLPYRDSALTHILKEALTGNQMHPCIVAHVNSGIQYYSESLQVVQLASKLNRLRRRRVGTAIAINPFSSEHHSPIDGTNDKSSSSVDSFSDYHSPQAAFRHRRFRGPRLGRSSYASSIGSASSELEFTSSSEQSCDTVIFRGKDRHEHTMKMNQTFNLPLARLGPRGMADGSVDTRSISSGHRSGTESPAHWDSSHTQKSITYLGEEENFSHSNAIKRMMPRTNATVWPRSMSSRKTKALLQPLAETWIDGPNATSTFPTEQSSLTSASSIMDCHPMAIAFRSFDSILYPESCFATPNMEHSSKPNVTPLSNIRSSNSLLCVEQSLSCTTSVFGRDRRQSGLPNSPNPDIPIVSCPTDHNVYSQNISSEKSNELSNQCSRHLQNWPDTRYSGEVSRSANEGSCSTLEHESKRGTRALSDISERTEETETVPDCNTFKSTSTNDALELVLDSLPYCTLKCNIGQNHDDFCKSMSSNNQMLPRETSLVTHKQRNTDFVAIEKILFSGTHNNSHILSNHPNIENSATSTQLEHAVNNDGMVFIRSDTTVPQITLTNVRAQSESPCVCSSSNPDRYHRNSICVSGCGDETTTADMFEAKSINARVEESCTHGTSLPPAMWPSPLPYQPPKGLSWSPIQNQLVVQFDRTIPVKYDEDHDLHTSTVEHKNTSSPTNPLLLRVAAWVNAIESPPTRVASPSHSTSSQYTSLQEVQHKTSSADKQPTVTREHSVSQAVGRMKTEFVCVMSSASPRTKVRPLEVKQRQLYTTPQDTDLAGSCAFGPEARNLPKPAQPYNFIKNVEDRHHFMENLAMTGIPTENAPCTAISQNRTKQFYDYSTPIIPSKSMDDRNKIYSTLNSSENGTNSLMCASKRGDFGLSVKTTLHTGLSTQHAAYPVEAFQTSNFRNPPRIPDIQKNEKSKGFRGFCFYTLPIFRNLRIRKDKKPKDKHHDTQSPLVETEARMVQDCPLRYSISPGPPFETPFVRSHQPFEQKLNNALRVVVPPSSGSLNARVPTYVANFDKRTQFTRIPTAHYSSGPEVKSQSPSHWDPIPCLRFERTNSNSPCKSLSPEHTQDHGSRRKLLCHSTKKQTVDEERQLRSTVNMCEKRDENVRVQTGMSTNPSTLLGYTGVLIGPVYRSGRRSIVGGPASSGYESMHIGTSELSLSHHDSASECSGLVLSSFGGQDCSQYRPHMELHRQRRHSCAAASRASGSIGSAATNHSPRKCTDDVARPNATHTLPLSPVAQVTSFIGQRSQLR